MTQRPSPFLIPATIVAEPFVVAAIIVAGPFCRLWFAWDNR